MPKRVTSPRALHAERRGHAHLADSGPGPTHHHDDGHQRGIHAHAREGGDSIGNMEQATKKDGDVVTKKLCRLQRCERIPARRREVAVLSSISFCVFQNFLQGSCLTKLSNGRADDLEDLDLLLQKSFSAGECHIMRPLIACSFFVFPVGDGVRPAYPEGTAVQPPSQGTISVNAANTHPSTTKFFLLASRSLIS